MTTQGLSPRRDSSNASTTTDNNDNNNNTNDDSWNEPTRPVATTTRNNTSISTLTTMTIETSPPPPPPPPKPIFSEARDVSCSSRDSLRRQVQKRRLSLTIQEQDFLDQLLVHGNEIEVQLAMETLQDDDLFFDHQTPKQDTSSSVVGVGGVGGVYGFGSGGIHNVDEEEEEEEDDLQEQDSEDHDVQRDTQKSTTTTTTSSSHSTAVASDDAPRQVAPSPRPTMSRGCSVGSTRRLQALEQRKHPMQQRNSQLLWKAHASGLAVSKRASRRSLQLRRESSIASLLLGVKASHSKKTNAAVLEIFRRRASAATSSGSARSSIVSGGRSSIVSATRSSASTNNMPKPTTPGMPPKPRYRRSQSMIAVPPVPLGMPMGRRSSTGSRKSVTFHDSTDGTPKPRPNKASNNRKVLTRSASDSGIGCNDNDAAAVPPPPPPPPLILTKEDSTGTTSTFPSIHHAHSVHSEVGSMSSIPSIHHAHPIRQDSVSSIPSLHHAHPIRQDSVSSIPSLHPAHPIRQDSIASAAAAAFRSDSIASGSQFSIPSLHHAYPLHRISDLMGVGSSRSSGGSDVVLDVTASQDQTAVLLQNFSANANVAAAWLEQQEKQQQQDMAPLQNVNIPNESTQPAVLIENDDDDLMITPQVVAKSQVKNKNLPMLRLEPPLLLVPPDNDNDQDKDVNPAVIPKKKPVLMRLASQNVYEGEGIEVTELDDAPMRQPSIVYSNLMMDTASVRTCTSWDEDLKPSSYQHPEIFRHLTRCRSDEDMSHILFGSTGTSLLLMDNNGTGGGYLDWNQSQPQQQPLHSPQSPPRGTWSSEDDSSWDMTSDTGSLRYDSWNVLKDEYVNGFGGGGTLGFLILGTSVDDESAQPHVLSPPLMESLQAFMPYSKSGENMLLKYSMVRDGANMHSFLKRARGAPYSLLALETVDGEVFGSFTGQVWRKNWNYFGTTESFLWRMRRSRLEKTHGVLEQAQLESEIDVFPYTGDNRFLQLCTHDRLAVGGGTPSAEKKTEEQAAMADHDFGFGLAINSDFLTGTTSPCVTFGSPSLSTVHKDGTVFEIVNLELWTMTPCRTVEDAEKLELGKLFLERN